MAGQSSDHTLPVPGALGQTSESTEGENANGDSLGLGSYGRPSGDGSRSRGIVSSDGHGRGSSDVVAVPAATMPGATFFTGLFIGAVVLGLVPVFISPQFWMIPLVSMLIYAYSGHGRARVTGTMFEFSDSIYYLGFTLSIGSLLASLEPFEFNQDPDPKKVFHLFGLGMLTTLFGVVARTALQTFHRMPTETIEEVNHRLVSESRRYVERLVVLNREIEGVINGAAGSYQNDVLPKLAAIEASLSSTVAHIESTSAASTAIKKRAVEVGDTLAYMAKKNEEAALSAKTLAESIGSAASATTEHARDVVRELTEIAARANLAQAALGEFAKKVGDISVDANPLTLPIAKVGRAIEEATTSVQKQVSSLGTVVQEFEKNTNAIRDSSMVISSPELRKTLARFEKEIAALADATREQRVATSAETESLRKQVEAALASARDVSAALEEVTNVALRRLERLTPV